jgi:hypothetical protein
LTQKRFHIECSYCGLEWDIGIDSIPNHLHECIHFNYVKYYDSLGRVRVQKQCLVCAKRSADKKHSEVDNPEDLPHRIDYEDAQEHRRQMREFAEQMVPKRTLEPEVDAWMSKRSRYHRYLRSPKWKERRKKVLERAEDRCEGCRAAKPTEVHHLNYDHVGDELLYELVALCRDCHEKAHEEKPGWW